MSLARSHRLPIMLSALFVVACRPYAPVDSKVAAGAVIRIQFSKPTPMFVSQDRRLVGASQCHHSGRCKRHLCSRGYAPAAFSTRS